MALLQQQHELLEQPADPLGVVAVDGDLVAPDVDRRRRGNAASISAQQLVALAEQAHHQVVAGDVDLDLRARHEVLRASVGTWERDAHNR